jgi:hypothetical protein
MRFYDFARGWGAGIGTAKKRKHSTKYGPFKEAGPYFVRGVEIRV